MNLIEQLDQIIADLRAGKRDSAEAQAKKLADYMVDLDLGDIPGWEEAWPDLLAAAEPGEHLLFCPEVQFLLDLLDEPDAQVRYICKDCQEYYHEGRVAAPAPGWSMDAAEAWAARYILVYERARETDRAGRPCESCGNKVSGGRCAWRVDVIVEEQEKESSNDFFS